MIRTFALLIVLLPASPLRAGQQASEAGGLTEASAPLGLHKGDLDGMQQRRMIRASVLFNKTNYFIDFNGQPRGMTYDALVEFERFVNRKLYPTDRTGKNKVLVVLIPGNPATFERDLLNGKTDIAAAPIIITEDRKKRADLVPTGLSREDVVISGPDAPALASLDDLSGKEVYLDKTGVGWQRLEARSKQLTAAGKPAIQLQAADANLQWEDSIEMAHAGMVQYAVVPLYLANLWKNVFPKLRIYPAFPVVEKVDTGWAVRKDSPKLTAMLEEFAKTHAIGTAFGNTLINRYTKNPQFIKNSRSAESIRRFQEMARLFQKYADKYEFPWLLVAAEAYQESGLNQAAKSPVGAIGVMQVMPSTAATSPVNISKIEEVENNIHAGVRLLKFIRDDYFKDDPMDPINKTLMTLAAYNAGPARIKQCREMAAKMGLDKDNWFNNVEYAVAKRVGAETVNYVSNIYKYYVGYKLNQSELSARSTAKPAPTKPTPPKKKV